ncbi:MAG: hypothetical protein AB9835_11240 [Eubacteriales bacterium]
MPEGINYSEKKICPDCNCAYFDAYCPICGKDENGKKHRIQKERPRRRGNKLFWTIVIIVVVLAGASRIWDEVLFMMYSYEGLIDGDYPDEGVPMDIQAERQPFPENGTTSYYTGDSPAGTVSVSNRLDDYIYVKFKSESLNKTIMEAYIHPDSTADIKVPLGRYRILFASGDEWYGNEYIFGNDTEFYMFGKVADIKIENGAVINQTIELKKAQSGSKGITESSLAEFLD